MKYPILLELPTRRKAGSPARGFYLGVYDQGERPADDRLRLGSALNGETSDELSGILIRQRVVFLSDRGGEPTLYLRAAQGRAPRALFRHPDLSEFCLTADAGRLAFTLTTFSQAQLFVTDLERWNPQLVQCQALCPRRIQFSPDGRYIYCQHDPLLDDRDGIYRLEVQTGRHERLAGEYSFLPCLSPDGLLLVYQRANARTQEIIRLDLATGRSKLLVKHLRGLITSLTFTPDGSRLLYTTREFEIRFKDSPLERLWAVPTDGGQAVEVDRDVHQIRQVSFFRRQVAA